MKYQVVELKEKKVVGITARTSNQDQNMGAIIGGLWQQFYEQGIYQAIPSKVNACSIGMYSNYQDREKDAYDVTVCCEVSTLEQLPAGVVGKTVEAGKYAKFVVKGNTHEVIADFWTKLWAMDLDRKYSCDFEEYQPGGDMENAEIHIYLALN
ncbi:GyrI-like domain-containing protein [Acetobacterium woodii]|uniref:Transcriptional regulator AraC family n=1 Tax=Acetobacterium woodii (strain ATCC 29683 / DSM 1030 / JCM 2381 / KCTC 1655 / WB1) TaxID=931626 RepID=H6LHP8_ACEWD|nr:GyrI-like domain-containing protein [Acetobacterium woodii]AFA47227.1 transcriptional regulator AraC family [Acetobacterium woodii DSM 1030]